MNSKDREYKLLYSVIVAGKNASFAEKALARFLLEMKNEETPFQYIKFLIKNDELYNVLIKSRCGNYSKILKCFTQIINIDVFNCTVDDLEAIHGIGPKTARFFLLATRPNVRYAALDTHILKWLRKIGYDAPKTTPTGKKYYELEKAFLEEADDMGLTAFELDSKIWYEYSSWLVD